MEVLHTRGTRSTFRHVPCQCGGNRHAPHVSVTGALLAPEAGAGAPAAARSYRGLDPCLHPVCLRQWHLLLQQLDLSIK